MNLFISIVCIWVLLGQAEPVLPDTDSSQEGDTDVAPLDPEAIKAAILELALTKNKEAGILLKKRKYPEALARYREAYELAPDNPEIVNNYGYIYFLLGNLEEADKLYRLSISLDSNRPAAYINLSDLIVEKDPENLIVLKEAAALLVKARELKGNTPKVILRQARIEAARGNFSEAERFYKEYLEHRKPTQRLKLEIGDFYRDLGQSEDAVFWYRKITGDELGRLAAGRIWEIEVEKQNVQFGWSNSSPIIPDKAKKMAHNARELFSRRDYGESERLFLEALAIAPTYAMARADYGDLLYRMGRIEDAELSYLRALALEHDNPEIHARIGKMYLATEGNKRAAEAAVFLKRALEIRPQWTNLHLKLAMALRQTGDLLSALEHVNTFLERIGDDDEKKEIAIGLKRAIETLIPPHTLIEAGVIEDNLSESINDMGPEFIEALRKAKAHLKRGELDAAMAQLRSLKKEHRKVEVLNLEARILLGAGRLTQAVDVLRESLLCDDKQAIVHEQLGLALIDLGESHTGRIHILRAEELGETGATYLLAKIDAGERGSGLVAVINDLGRLDKLLLAQDRLERFLVSGAASIYHSEAEVLKQEIESRFDGIRLFVLTIGGLLFLLLVVLSVRIWGGINLQQLIADCPETGIQVQRVLSAIRHEVLKHNTMMLEGLVQAIENQEDVSGRIGHFKKSFLGNGNNGGVVEKMESYLRDLQKIGDANRKRLNLRRKDPAMSPLIKGMELIRRNGSKLAKFKKLRSGPRASLLKDLKNASSLLNIKAYEAVRGLLERLRILRVDPHLLRDIYERCIREPSFAHVNFEPLELAFPEDMGANVGIPVPRAAFEDIMTNLIRNAVQSSLLYSDGPEQVGIGLQVTDEIDMITGLERVVFYVKDKSHKVLTAEMLRGRYIEEGLGLTADLVTRYEGTLDVLEGDGLWSKSVIVKLPKAEESEDTGASIK